MAFPIDSPLPIFYDRNGDVLDAGYVYIGTPNLNPITSPVSVYWDAAQTIPAPQPLRTVRGFIARNGAPANLYVTGDFSIVVQDMHRQLVISEPTAGQIAQIISVVGGANGSSFVGFIQAGTGAESTTVQEELRYFVRPEQFGAVADGVTDDLIPIQRAITYANSVRLPVVFSGKSYALSGPITFDLATSSYIGNGSTLDFSTAPNDAKCVSVVDANINKLNHYVDGFYFTGRGQTSLQSGVFFGAPSTSAAIHAIRNCAVLNFFRGAEWGNNSFLQSFVQCMFRNCGTLIYIPPGLADFAENISFYGCTFAGSNNVGSPNFTTTGFDIAECEVYLYGCSVDYILNSSFKLGNAATLTMVGGHFENFFDNDYWVNVNGTNSVVSFLGTEFLITSGGPGKTVYPLGYCDATTASAINFDRCSFIGFNGTLYPFPFIVEGYGDCSSIRFINGGTGSAPDKLGCITHSRASDFSDGGFVQTNLRDWFVADAGSVVSSTTLPRTGLRSMALSTSAGQVANAEARMRCEPGSRFVWTGYLNTTGWGADSAYIATAYLDKYGNVIGSTATQEILAANIPTSYTKYSIRPDSAAPSGTAQVYVQIFKRGPSLGSSDGNGVLYVDDVYCQIIGSGGANFTEFYYFPRSAVTANTTFRIPNNYAIDGIKIQNTTANAVTGGIRIGTTGGGTQVATALTVGANADLFIPASALTLSFFSSTANQTLFFEAVSAWNSASLNVNFVCRRVG